MTAFLILFFLGAIRYLFSNSIADNIAITGGIAHGDISLNKSEPIRTINDNNAGKQIYDLDEATCFVALKLNKN
ncbi:MAG: hypothetical protein AAF717_10065 [Bacteroidota bacterium]